MERNFDWHFSHCSPWCCSHCLPTSRVSPLLFDSRRCRPPISLVGPARAFVPSRCWWWWWWRRLLLLLLLKAIFFFRFRRDSKTLQNANAAHRSASRDDAKNASSVFSRRMSLKTLARRGKRTETRNTETTTIVGEEHRFCLVVDERGGRGAEELCASTPDESISRLVQ